MKTAATIEVNVVYLQCSLCWLLAVCCLLAGTFNFGEYLPYFFPINKLLFIERFHSRGHHLCKFIGTKESIYIREEIKSHTQDWFKTPTWLPFHCFGTPIWPP